MVEGKGKNTRNYLSINQGKKTICFLRKVTGVESHECSLGNFHRDFLFNLKAILGVGFIAYKYMRLLLAIYSFLLWISNLIALKSENMIVLLESIFINVQSVLENTV